MKAAALPAENSSVTEFNMRNAVLSIFLLLPVAISAAHSLPLVDPSDRAPDEVRTANGSLQGTSDSATGIRTYKGIPYAAPPVGDLRWKEPQPVKSWKSVRKADTFGPRAMQLRVFDDMVFRSNG